MCGIVGCVMKGTSGFHQKQEDIFFELLFADQLRGEDSTGIIGIEKDTTFHIAKEASKASDFLPKYKGSATSTAMWNFGKAYIGHNRKKTVGEVKDETAHPFVVDGTFAMVHNGTLDHGWGKLAKGRDDITIDSEALAVHFHDALKKGMEDGDKKTDKFFEQALSEVSGAYAVAMYDQTRHKLFLTRNKDRPLSLIETDDAWYFMSESVMGAWILTRYGRGGLTRYLTDKIKVTGINEHEVITFDLEKNTMGREQLSPKKSWSSGKTSGSSNSKPITNGGSTDIPTNIKKGAVCFEQDFKRFKRDWEGKRVTVHIEDLLEQNYPDEKLEWGNADDLYLYAHSAAIPWMHAITIPVSAKKFNIESHEDVLGKKWVIDLEKMELSSHGVIRVEGGDPKPVLTSSLKLVGNETNREFRSQLAKMEYEELHVLAAEIKYTGPDWQRNSVNTEIVWRDGMTTLQRAHDLAKKRGIILQQVKRNDKFIYQDQEGNIYYECAIAVQ